MTDCRPHIIHTYAAWTALSALRSGAPIKSRQDIYRLLHKVHFDKILDGSVPLKEPEFADWHRTATRGLCDLEPRLCVGWTVKLLNAYLKTAGYIGDLGRRNSVMYCTRRLTAACGTASAGVSLKTGRTL